MATKDEDLKLEEQKDGSVALVDPNAVPEDSEDDDAEGAAQASTPDDEDHDSEESPQSETEDERVSRTEENRRKRQEKKQRIAERNERMRSELAARDAMIADLTARVAQQERKTTGSELAQIDTEIKKAAEAYGYFKNQIALAHGQPEAGPLLAEAAEKMMLAKQRYDMLQGAKQNYVKVQNQPQAVDPVLLNHGQKWMERNSWYNPDSGDEDSEIMLLIDKRLAAEGWNPRTPEYWDELDKRAQKRLPHRYKSWYNKSNESRPKPVVTGSGREVGNKSGSAGYTISADRVAAMKEAGIWDDPVKRADMIRRYREQDKLQAA